jgi:hypothetical protein
VFHAVVCWISGSNCKSRLAQGSGRQLVTVRTAICHRCRLTIVAAQQDCKPPLLACCLLMWVAAIIIRQAPALAYAPRSVLNLMLGGPRRARHGLGPSGVGTSRSPKDDQKPEKWVGNVRGAKRAMQIFVRQLCVIQMRSVERRLTVEKWTRLHGES